MKVRPKGLGSSRSKKPLSPSICISKRAIVSSCSCSAAPNQNTKEKQTTNGGWIRNLKCSMYRCRHTLDPKRRPSVQPPKQAGNSGLAVNDTNARLRTLNWFPAADGQQSDEDRSNPNFVKRRGVVTRLPALISVAWPQLYVGLIVNLYRHSHAASSWGTSVVLSLKRLTNKLVSQAAAAADWPIQRRKAVHVE